MFFMLCVTPVVSSQMQLCSTLAIQILFDKLVLTKQTAKTLVLAGTNYKPRSNISVLMHCWSSFGNMVSTHIPVAIKPLSSTNVMEIDFQ